MVGPLSNKSYIEFIKILKSLLINTKLQERILAEKNKWLLLEKEDRVAGKVYDEDDYHAKQFGLAAQDIFEEFAITMGIENLHHILMDANYEKDLRLGDFVLKLFIEESSILFDTKFCYTLVPKCYGSVSYNSKRNYSGWYICFSTECDSLIGIWAEYFKEQIEERQIVPSGSSYLYKDYRIIVEEALAENSPYVFKIDK